MTDPVQAKARELLPKGGAPAGNQNGVTHGHTMGLTELKSCPFCGPGQSMVDLWFDDVSKRWAVGCGRCGASSGRSVHAEGSKEAAIKSWNTRAEQQAEARKLK